MVVEKLLVEIAVKDAIIFYQNYYISLLLINSKENRDMWRCNYAISKLQIMSNILNESKELDNQKLTNLISIFGNMNKGLEQFSSQDINQNHIKLNTTIYLSLNSLIPFFDKNM